MPNFCSNHIVITAESEDDEVVLQELLLKMKLADGTYTFRFNDFIPRPQDNQYSTTEYCDWYSWSLANWGTKWDLMWVNVEVTDNEISIHGDTAWSPPFPFLQSLSNIYPTLTFYNYYAESGSATYGKAQFKGGKELNRIEHVAENGFWSDLGEVGDEPILFPFIADFLEEHGLHSGG